MNCGARTKPLRVLCHVGAQVLGGGPAAALPAAAHTKATLKSSCAADGRLRGAVRTALRELRASAAGGGGGEAVAVTAAAGYEVGDDAQLSKFWK